MPKNGSYPDRVPKFKLYTKIACLKILDIRKILENNVNHCSLFVSERVFLCYTASIDLGLSVVDFGMVPDGAKCGDGMVTNQI